MIEHKKSKLQNPKFVHKLFSSIAKRYVITNHILSLWMDVLWREKLIKFIVKKNPSMLLDVATGSGDLALNLQKKLPNSIIIGTDFCEEMLEEAKKRGLKKTVVANALSLPFKDDSIDALTVAYGLRNMENWDEALKEFLRVLRGGGSLYILDFSMPESSFIKNIYRLYLHKILPVIGHFLTKNKEAYNYLGESIESFPSRENMTNKMKKIGFEKSNFHSLFYGTNCIYIAEKPWIV